MYDYLPSWIAVSALVLAQKQINKHAIYKELGLGPSKENLMRLIEIENIDLRVIEKCVNRLETL